MAGRRHYVEVRMIYGKDASAELNEWAATIIMEAKLKEKNKHDDEDVDR